MSETSRFVHLSSRLLIFGTTERIPSVRISDSANPSAEHSFQLQERLQHYIGCMEVALAFAKWDRMNSGPICAGAGLAWGQTELWPCVGGCTKFCGVASSIGARWGLGLGIIGGICKVHVDRAVAGGLPLHFGALDFFAWVQDFTPNMGTTLSSPASVSGASPLSFWAFARQIDWAACLQRCGISSDSILGLCEGSQGGNASTMCW